MELVNFALEMTGYFIRAVFVWTAASVFWALLRNIF